MTRQRLAKKPERNELEFLRGENRKLRSENRHLRKELGRSNKKVQVFESTVSEREDAEFEDVADTAVPVGMRCPKCSGETKQVDLGSRSLITCDECGHRKSVPKRGK